MIINDDTEIIFWQNERFYRKPVRAREVLRFEAGPGDFNGASLWLWTSGQWGAKFRGGTYSIALTPELALYEAVDSAIGMLKGDVQNLLALLER